MQVLTPNPPHLPYVIDAAEDAVPAGLALSSLLAMVNGAGQGAPSWATAGVKAHGGGDILKESASRLLECLLRSKVQDIREAR